MRYYEINEANLKLLKGDIPRVRGSYGAFLITMRPEDFLRLTASPKDLEYIKSHQFPKSREDFENYGDPKDYGRYSIPFLTVEHPSGKVKGHEGRHRALMVLNSGGTTFPVVIYLRETTVFEVSYEEHNTETDEEHKRVEQFASYDAAKARADKLEAWNQEQRDAWQEAFDADQPIPVSDILIFRVRIETLGGGTIKGSPTQSDPENYWDRKAFVDDDMPKQLLGQTDSSIVVTNYRIGKIKGYTHFR